MPKMSRKEGKTEDLRNMLMSFRIAELQTLLASCGRSRSGRKHELLGRAVSLLRTDGSPMRERVRSRILELYHQRYPTSTAATSLSSNSVPQPYSQPFMSSYGSEKEETPTYLNRRSHYSSSKQHLQAHQSSNYSSLNDPHRMVGHSSHSIYEPPHRGIHSVSGVPVHPDVRFIALPFYDIIDVLNKPTSLVQKTVAGYQETHLACSFSPYQTQMIQNSRSYNVKNMLEYAVQVQIRFCLAETSCIQEDLYPPRCKIIVNGKSCPLPGQPPPNAQNQEPRKPHRPVNITPLCRLSPTQSNQITVQWMPSDMGQRHAATIHLVRTVPTDTLIRKLKERKERAPEHTIAFIKEKLKQDPDSEIALTSLKVSLCCPISRTKMKMPCRANNCKHLQCFDGETYIQLNERKPSWVCPVCDQKAHYDNIFKDGMFTNIIQKSTNSDDIVFFEDGSWRESDVQDPSKPLSQVVTTPKAPAPPIVDCKTPPPLSVGSPALSTTPVKRDYDSIPPEMPKLEKAVLPPHPRESARAESSGNEDNEDEEVEVITIDDSDSDTETPVNPIPSMSEASNRSLYRSYADNGLHQSSSLPFTDPDLQGLDLYNLLPHEDRIAAAMYLDQAGRLGQLMSNHNSRPSPSSIIDISDE